MTVPVCQAPGCAVVLEDRRPEARFCSDRCRAAGWKDRVDRVTTLEPDLTAEDVRVLRCLPTVEDRQSGVRTSVEVSGLTYVLPEEVIWTIGGLEQLGLAAYYGAWFRTAKGDAYLDPLSAPASGCAVSAQGSDAAIGAPAPRR